MNVRGSMGHEPAPNGSTVKLSKAPAFARTTSESYCGVDISKTHALPQGTPLSHSENWTSVKSPLKTRGGMLASGTDPAIIFLKASYQYIAGEEVFLPECGLALSTGQVGISHCQETMLMA